ncbi:hypothetical protein Pelo_4274 [Pelomyxa schiedti]|nr:hypothetical protein Pelo_4274 [Pelomyxa schiedti]
MYHTTTVDDPHCQETSTTTTSADARATALSRAVWVSRIVWDWVVPWLVPPSRGPHGEKGAAPAMTREQAAALCGVAEAMFPLRRLARRALVARCTKWHVALRAAAEAGSTSCVDWLLTTRRRTADEEEAARDGEGEGEAVVQLVSQQEKRNLVDGDWPGLAWVEYPPLLGGADHGEAAARSHGNIDCGNRELGDYVRDSQILTGVCQRGWGDVAKWIVQRFEIRELWEFVKPMGAALEGGHLELAQWMAGTFNLLERFREYSMMKFHTQACKSENLEVVKWYFERSPPLEDSGAILATFCACLEGKKSNSCVEICKYAREYLGLPCDPDSDWFNELSRIRRVDVLQWVVSEFNVAPSIDDAGMYCQRRNALEFLKFLLVDGLDGQPILTATPALFISACKGIKGSNSMQVVKWLSTRVNTPLSAEEIDLSFITALANNETSIARWLEDSHHILAQNAGGPKAVRLIFRVCRAMPRFGRESAGIEWLLDHLDLHSATPQQITRLVLDSVEDNVTDHKSLQAVILLLEKFQSVIPEENKLDLISSVLQHSINDEPEQVQRITTLMGGIIRSNKPAISRCLAECCYFGSTKAVKWLITQFHLERGHITAYNNTILIKVVSMGQECCAEWLINQFGITFDEIQPVSHVFLDGFPTMKMLVEVFPGITGTNIKEKLLPLVCQSPIIAQFTLRHFPEVTREDIAGPCSTSYGSTSDTHCWLIDTPQEQH